MLVSKARTLHGDAWCSGSKHDMDMETETVDPSQRCRPTRSIVNSMQQGSNSTSPLLTTYVAVFFIATCACCLVRLSRWLLHLNASFYTATPPCILFRGPDIKWKGRGTRCRLATGAQQHALPANMTPRRSVAAADGTVLPPYRSRKMSAVGPAQLQPLSPPGPLRPPSTKRSAMVNGTQAFRHTAPHVQRQTGGAWPTNNAVRRDPLSPAVRVCQC